MTSIEQKIIKPKLGCLELAKQLGSVSQACKTMGYSRDSFYRFKKLYENGGEALREISERKPIIKNRVPEHVARAVVALAIKNPALGHLRASQELLQQGVIVSSGGVRSIWLRERPGKHEKAAESPGGALRTGRHPAHGGTNCRAGKDEVSKGGSRGDRNPSSWLSRGCITPTSSAR